MRPEDFDPKTFFAFHDLNGDGVWDQDEVKVSRSEQEGYFLVHCTYKKESSSHPMYPGSFSKVHFAFRIEQFPISGHPLSDVV